MPPTLYRGFRIDYEPKPIPDHSHDWDWAHEDYDGPGDHRCGTSASLGEAQREIDAWYEEHGDGAGHSEPLAGPPNE